MKSGKLFSCIVSIVLLCILLLNLTACLMTSAEDLMEGISPRDVIEVDDFESCGADITDFSLRLFKATAEQEKNTLVSPLSVLYALAMTVNGAEGETLSEMEGVLGMNAEEVNLYLHSYLESLPEGENYKLSLANSIWFKGDPFFNVDRDFLQTNADYYGADIYKAPFDRSTLRDINSWVKKETDGEITKVLDNIPEDAIMYLVNALAFEAEWMSIYKNNQVREGIFTTESGEEQSVDMMYSGEHVYLEDDNAKGFIKYYKGRKYAFAAILPDEGITVSEYLNTLDGEGLYSLLSNAESATVRAAIPKFETEYSTEMAEVLCKMGMPTAFDPDRADFSGIGNYSSGNIFINRVIHKTHIRVDERGTKAGAVTVIEMGKNSAADPGEIKTVYLDRPFVYMLIDCENNIPLFIGTTMNVK